ncbi:MAG: hypothetical protein O3A20_05890 [Planctomycetota bacterium]|nr:hypothetical protein [Planctomycetota bacterium]
MATSLGIHLRADGFSFALVEGGAKKHSLKAIGDGALTVGAAPKAIGKAIAELVKVRKADHVCVVTPSSRVVLRELSLPFADREKVLQVLKFEIESELYHLDVDDVVADFITLEGERATPSLLVGVMPKEHVRQSLEVLAGGGWDPHSVQASYGAYAAALSVIVPKLSGSVAGASEEDAVPLQFAHLGATETLIAQVGRGGRLRALRTIPLGWLDLVRDLAPPKEAAGEVLPPGTSPDDAEADADAAAGEGEESDAAEAAPTALFGADPLIEGCTLAEAIARAGTQRVQALTKRLANELRRAVAAMPAGAAEVFLTGADLPGWEAVVSARTGLTVRHFDSTSGEDERRADLIALGGAYAGLGMTSEPMNFRQEEFRYARGLERVEGPLTLALVGLIAWLVIDAGVHLKQGLWLKKDADRIYVDANARVVQLNKRVTDDETYPKDWLVKNDLTGASVPTDQRIRLLANRLSDSQRQLDSLMGEADVEMPASCLEAWRLLMIFLEKEFESFNEKWMIESIEFTSVDASRGNNAEATHVVTKFGLTLLSEDAELTAGVYDRIERGLKSQPWCIGSPVIPTTEAVKVGTGKNAIITVKINTAREAQP